MSGDFIDSNVIVHAFDPTDRRKQMVATGLLERALLNGGAWISFQVVQEVLNVLTWRPAPAFSYEDAALLLRETLDRLWRVMPSRRLYESGLNIQARYGYAFYDSLIVAAALDSGCTRLLSEDLQAGQVIDGMTIENPFAAGRRR